MGLEEAERLLAEQRAKVKQLQAEEATAHGFAAYDEYWNSGVEASRKERLEEERVFEQRAKEMGMTLEQLQYKMEIDDPQRFVPRGFLNLPPPCDCEDHLSDFFCPKALVSHTTQEGGELAEMLARQRAIHIDHLHIEEGDQSRRLNQDMLEKVWVRSSQDHGLQIPFWGHADPVVKQLINLTSRPHSLSPSPSPSPALSSRFQSIIDQTSEITAPSTNASVLSKSLNEQSRQPPSQSPESTSLSRREAIHARPTQPSEIASKAISRRKTQSRTKSRPPRRREAVHNSGRRAVSSGRIEKLSSRPSLSTRSQKVPCLYELGPNGVAVHQQLSGHIGRKLKAKVKP